MGANMLLACLPAAEMTDQRVRQLHELVDRLSQEEVNDGCQEDEEDPRQMLHRHVDQFAQAEDRSDVVMLRLPPMPYPTAFTGGMSWGDLPTDIFDTFIALADCKPLVRKLEEWAQEDIGGTPGRQVYALLIRHDREMSVRVCESDEIARQVLADYVRNAWTSGSPPEHDQEAIAAWFGQRSASGESYEIVLTRLAAGTADSDQAGDRGHSELTGLVDQRDLIPGSLELRSVRHVRPGDTVIYRDPVDEARTHTAEFIDSGMKNDQPIWSLNDGHWCYEFQVVQVVPQNREDPNRAGLNVTSARADDRPTQEVVALATGVYQAVLDSTDGFYDSEFGADLAYLLGAILNDSLCEWPRDQEILSVLQEALGSGHPVWAFIRIADD